MTAKQAENGTAPASAALTKKPEVDRAAAALVPAEQAVRLRAVPFGMDGARLRVAMVDATDLAAADEIAACTGKPVRRVAITAEAFAELLRDVHGITAAQMAGPASDGRAAVAHQPGEPGHPGSDPGSSQRRARRAV